MNYTIIVLVFIIIIMLYVAYLYMTNTTLTQGILNLASPGDPGTIGWKKLDNPGSSQYHYEGWLYIVSVPSDKTSIFRRDLKNTTCTGLVLNGSTLSFGKTTGTAIAPADALATKPAVATMSDITVITTDFPAQKWVYFVVNINGQLLECYLNGKLIKTEMIPTSTNLTPAARKKLYLGDTSIDGVITKFKFEPKTLTTDEVWKRYLEGNGLASFSNMLAGYNLTFSLSNTTEEVKKYTLL